MPGFGLCSGAPVSHMSEQMCGSAFGPLGWYSPPMKLSCLRNGLSGSVDLPNTNSPSRSAGGKPAPLVDAVLRFRQRHAVGGVDRAEAARNLFGHFGAHRVENRQGQRNSAQAFEEGAAVESEVERLMRCLQ